MRTAIRTLGTLATVLVPLLCVPFANAQQLCLPRDSAVAELASRYEEHVTGRGLAAGGRTMIELFVSKSGTWTVIVTDVDGKSCIVASGKSWTEAPLYVGDPA